MFKTCSNRIYRLRMAPQIRTVVTKGPLISDPLKFDNTRKLRDTKSRFPKPNFVSFDAFGTIYTPFPSVFKQYYEISSNLGFGMSEQDILNQFPTVHKQMLADHPNYGKNSPDIEDSYQWWSELIRRLFSVGVDAKSNELCDQLINRFKSGDGYHLFEDVIPTFTKLKENNIRILISSNSDSSVYDVLENLGVLPFVESDDVYISYNLLSEKPQKVFFDSVSNSQISKATGGPLTGEDRSSFLANCWHVGDSAPEDYIGSVKAGWNGILLDRDISSGFLSPKIPDPDADTPAAITKPDAPKSFKPLQIIANNRIIISDLTQLDDLFGLN